MNSMKLRESLVEIAKKQGINSFKDSIDRLEENIEISIALLGEFSSGKTTLVNALINKNILPISDIPTTASIVEIVGADELKAFIENNEGIKEVELSEISQFVMGEKSKEILKAIINIPESGIINKGFKFVDTPGLSSLNDIHTDITFGYLPSVDCAILVMDINTGGFNDRLLEFLKSKIILENDLNKIIIVLNKIDQKKEFNKIVEETAEILKPIIKNPVIIPISAKLALQDEKVKSNISELENYISKNVIEAKTEMVEQRVGKELIKKSKELKNLLKEKLESIDMSTSELDDKIVKYKKDIDAINLKKEKIKEKFEQTIKIINTDMKSLVKNYTPVIVQYILDKNDEIENIMKSFGNTINKIINTHMDSLENALNKEISSLNFLDGYSYLLLKKLDVQIVNFIKNISGIIDMASSLIFALIAAALTGPVGVGVGEVGIETIGRMGFSEVANNSKNKNVIRRMFGIVGEFIEKNDVLKLIIKTLAKQNLIPNIEYKINEHIGKMTSELLDKVQLEINEFFDDEIITPINNLYDMIYSIKNERRNKIDNIKNNKRELSTDIKSLDMEEYEKV